MTHEDAGNYAGKHPADRKPDADIAEQVKDAARDGTITCSAAHQIADTMKVAPSEIGFTIDYLEIRLRGCQLGLFGYPQGRIVKPAEKVSDELRDEIHSRLIDGQLYCAEAWDIADRMGISRRGIADACEKLGIKIRRCQLGAF